MTIFSPELKPAEVHCRLPPNISTNGSIPTAREPITGHEVLSQCDVYQDYDVNTNITIGCPDGWFYSEEVYTIVNQVTFVLMRKPFSQSQRQIVLLQNPT